MTDATSPTAAVMLIGNELLSGRTQDKNLQYIATELGKIGVRLQECRVVPDIEHRIVDTVNELRKNYDYVFTTGGIGPTHDDITATCVAKAFGLSIKTHAGAMELLVKEYGGAENVTESRARMALFPENAGLLHNGVSGAPGFYVENVFVMAGIPRIMQSMCDCALSMIKRGRPVLSEEIEVNKPESVFAEELEKIQSEYTPDVDVGSYPGLREGRPMAAIVLRGVDQDVLNKAAEQVRLRIVA